MVPRKKMMSNLRGAKNMRFRNKRTDEINVAYSVEIRDDKVYIKFAKNGKEYAYYKDNIELLNEVGEAQEANCFKIYKMMKQCYKCHKNTSVFTYIIFDDGTDQDVIFPWDKRRLLKNQNIFAHIQDPSIEYYGLKVVGEDERLDSILMEKFPDKIKSRYSKTQNRSYPMNICDHCGAIQGWNFIFRQVNELIKEMKEIEILV